MDDLIANILSVVLAVLLGSVCIFFTICVIYGMLNIIGEIIDWFVGRFGK